MQSLRKIAKGRYAAAFVMAAATGLVFATGAEVRAQDANAAIFDSLFSSIEKQQEQLDQLQAQIDAVQARIEVLENAASPPDEPSVAPLDPQTIADLQAQIDELQELLDSVCGGASTPESCSAVASGSAAPSNGYSGGGEVVPPIDPEIPDPEEAIEPQLQLAGYVIAVDDDNVPALVALSDAETVTTALPTAEECKPLGVQLVQDVDNRQDNRFFVQDNEGEVRVCRFVLGEWHVLAGRKTTLGHFLVRAPE